MPFRINGIGTWHIGRNNAFSAPGRCMSCGAYANLSSYDTRNWITFLFVPVIPLGARRVIHHCPRCDQFHVMPRKRWEAARAEAVQALDRFVSEGSSDSGAAVEAIAQAASFQDRAVLDAAAPGIADRFVSDGAVLRELSEAYLYVGDLQAAQEYGERALDVDAGDDTQILLGRIMLVAGSLDDARACFERILQGGLLKHASVLISLVQAYQYEGRHEDALRLLGEIEAAFPEAERNPMHQKFKRISSKHRYSGKRVKMALDAPRTSIITRLAVGVVVLFLLLNLAAIGWVEWYDASYQDTYFVNGLSEPYSVNVGGHTFIIPAKSFVRHDLSSGSVRVQTKRRPIENPDTEIVIPGTVWSRLGREGLFIVNLDQLALLDWQKHGYADSNLARRDELLAEAYEYKPYTGELTYEIPYVHYAFVHAPDEIDIRSLSRVETRTELLIDDVTSDENLTAFIWEQLGEDAGMEYAQRLFRTYRPSTETLTLLFDYTTEEVFLDAAFARMRAGDVEYHRLLQELAKYYLDPAELQARYLDFAERDPENAEYVYLVGRTFDDAREGRSYFLRAIEGPQPPAHAFHALAYSARSAGRFEEGLEYARQAVARAPENSAFRDMAISLAFACGSMDDAIALAREAMDSVRPRDHIAADAMRYELMAMCASGRADETPERIDELARYVERDLQRAQRDDAGEIGERLRAYLTESVAYLTCGERGLEELGSQFENPFYVYESELLDGDMSTLAEILDEPEYWTWDTHLMFAIGARLHDRSEAGRCLENAVAAMESVSAPHARLAAMLSGAEPLDTVLAENLVMEPNEKALALTAMALFLECGEQDASTLRALARALNYERAIPYYLVDRAAAAAPAAVAGAAQ